MTDYTNLVEALRCKRDDCEGCDLAFFDKDEGWMCQYAAKDDDAAAAIEDLQKDLTTLQKCYEIADTTVDEVLKQLPKRGHWEPVPDAEGRPYKYVCSNCHRFHVNEDEWYGYCPNCGAVMGVPIMDGPIITPCRGCPDYDGYGGCKSKGGCVRKKMKVQDENHE